ncbi:MAG: hypothetical protein EOP48_18550 [Sphingobacteriales bacterium]|nr:MAG: hypothetical protein EOP48_18550 [Sphingobacteriales bacterium]
MNRYTLNPYLKAIFCLGILFSTVSYAQDIKGKWYGVATVDGVPDANNYMCELLLEQKGNKVTGYFNYFFRNGYFTNKITGNYDSKTRKLKIQTFPILFYRTVKVGTGIDCYVLGDFTFLSSRLESSLSGQFYSEQYPYTCPPINVKFRKMLKEEPTLKQKAELVSDTTPMEAPKMKVPQAIVNLNMRTKEIVRILDVSEDSVRVDFYDNGEYDQDSISVFYNGAQIIEKKELSTRTPISFKVRVDSIEENNDLVMYAENVGTIPPNAALMIVTDKEHRYEINLISNYVKNAAVRLRRVAKKKP